ncbi:S1 family peptidase [Streptomyces sp. NBC_01198]|uniref:S1 family peptidase n=1 Tax=Streptomyces sp. NBC_01198 TaxID=2903769 RepID=UPI002E11E20E|nr:serine protease [Streptomyces sp. NBC_01198]
MKLLRLLATSAVALGLLAVAAPAMADNSPSIVGGTPATQAYPFAGSLQLDNHGDPNWGTCGVTLINPSFVETNAHCVTNEPSFAPAARTAQRLYGNWLSANADPAIDRTDPGIYHIRLGSNDRLNGGIVRHVKAITVHPGWDWGTPDAAGEVADIALLELDKPVTSVKPAVIHPVNSTLIAREIGWGLTTEVPPSSPTNSEQFLRQIDVPVVDSSACADAGISAGELCLGGQGGGTCNGDSGSPALQLQGTGPAWSVIVGSTSRAALDTCGSVGEPDVYTDLSYFQTWLIGVIYGEYTGAGSHVAPGKALASAE